MEFSTIDGLQIRVIFQEKKQNRKANYWFSRQKFFILFYFKFVVCRAGAQ